MTSTTSYIDIAEAQTFFNERFGTEAWDLASDDFKLRALKQATKSINALNFMGSKTVSTQANEFPRSGDTVVGDDIKEACCEIAYSLLDGAEVDLERQNLTADSQGISDARATYTRVIAVDHIAAGIASARAWDILKPYLYDGRGVRVSRS